MSVKCPIFEVKSPRPKAGARIDKSAVLEVAELRKSYDRKSIVLESVSLSLGSGENVALIGANGCGKSTFLRCCLRLIEPDDGSVNVLGQDVIQLRRSGLRRMRAQVGFVFQKHHLVQRLTALTNVVHGAQGRDPGPRTWFQSLAAREVREEALECLGRVGLADFAGRRVDELSLGQAQRVAIARCLMQRPELVFADEPVASLDPRGGEEVMELFSQLMHQRRTSVLFTSHQIDHALRFSDRIVGLRKGRVALDQPPHKTGVAELRQFYE